MGCVEQSDGVTSADLECSDNTVTGNLYDNIYCEGNAIDTQSTSSGCASDGITYIDFKCDASATEKFISYTIIAVLMVYLF